jgi:cytochrome c oxidase subunit 2
MDLFNVIFWVAVFIFVVVGGGLLYTVIRFRRRPGQGIPAQVHGNTALEIGWTIAPTLVLAVVAVPTLLALVYVSNAPKDSLEVNVTAHQWWWEFEYPGLGVVTANELHVPVGKSVKVNLTSKDVIHSFWVPKLAGKMDIFPGKTTDMWFKADEGGEYFGQCAEFCGQSHAWMRFRVIVDTLEGFEAWVEKEGAQAAKPTTPEAERGAQLFLSKGCIACHTISGVPGAVGVHAPNLTHLGSRSTLAAGIMEMNADNLRGWLTAPNDIKPGNIMSKEAPVYTDPALSLSEEDIDGLVAYLQSLK